MTDALNYKELAKIFDLLEEEANQGIYTSTRLLAMLHFIDKAALRNGEVRKLRKADIRLLTDSYLEVRVLNTSRGIICERTVPLLIIDKDGNSTKLNQALIAWLKLRNEKLKENRNHSPYLFCTNNGKPLDCKNLAHYISSAARRADVRAVVTTQTIRRLRISQFLKTYGADVTRQISGYGSVRAPESDDIS